MDDGDRPLSIGIEDQFVLRIEGRRIDMIADGDGGDHFPGVGVHDRHHLAAAAQEEAAIFAVYGHAAGRGTGCSRPAAFDLEVSGINLNDLTFIFQVVEYVAFAVGCGEFRTASEIDGTRYLARCRVDCGGAITLSVESKDAFSSVVVNDPIGILWAGNLREDLHRLQVEHQHGIGFTVTDETMVELGSQGDTVDPNSGNTAQRLARLQVQYLHLGAVRHVEATSLSVDGKIVPAALAGDRYLLYDRISGVGSEALRREKRHAQTASKTQGE